VNSKRTIYITSFTLLGILLSTIVHAAIEIPVINLLVADFDRYSLVLSWGQWFLVHHVGTVILWVAGVAFGYWQGKYWWQVIYVEGKRFRK
jgi:Sec-independent protein secretion pathway component TatC